MALMGTPSLWEGAIPTPSNFLVCCYGCAKSLKPCVHLSGLFPPRGFCTYFNLWGPFFDFSIFQKTKKTIVWFKHFWSQTSDGKRFVCFFLGRICLGFVCCGRLAHGWLLPGCYVSVHDNYLGPNLPASGLLACTFQ